MISYTLIDGSLPSGLYFNSGRISGTPSIGTEGIYSFAVVATSGSLTAQQSFSLLVDKKVGYDTIIIIVNNETRTFNNYDEAIKYLKDIKIKQKK